MKAVIKMLNNSKQTKTMETKRYFAGAAITLLLVSSASLAPLHAQGRGRGMGSGMGMRTGGMTGGMTPGRMPGKGGMMGGMTPGHGGMMGMTPGRMPGTGGMMGMTPGRMPGRMGDPGPMAGRIPVGRGPGRGPDFRGTDVVRNGWRGGDRVRFGTETIYSSGVGYPGVDVAPFYPTQFVDPAYIYPQPVVPVVEAPLVYAAAPVVVGVGISSGYIVGHRHVGRIIERRTTIIRHR